MRLKRTTILVALGLIGCLLTGGSTVAQAAASPFVPISGPQQSTQSIYLPGDNYDRPVKYFDGTTIRYVFGKVISTDSRGQRIVYANALKRFVIPAKGNRPAINVTLNYANINRYPIEVASIFAALPDHLQRTGDATNVSVSRYNISEEGCLGSCVYGDPDNHYFGRYQFNFNYTASSNFGQRSGFTAYRVNYLTNSYDADHTAYSVTVLEQAASN